ncbi:MAG TPA: XisH family protein [Humisphaera sp.]
MSAKDAIHDAVKAALVKDGWRVTGDPHTLRFVELALLPDLAAERPVSAERAGDKIIVEIKSFPSRSMMRDFELALGQYLIYRAFLEEVDPDRKIYLAVPDRVYRTFFSLAAIKHVLARYQVMLVIIDVEAEEVVTWTS